MDNDILKISFIFNVLINRTKFGSGKKYSQAMKKMFKNVCPSLKHRYNINRVFYNINMELFKFYDHC